MAIFHMTCSNERCGRHGLTQRWFTDRLLLARDQQNYPCTACGGTMVRQASGPGVRMVERLDNGTLARAVERPEHIHELIDEDVRAKEGGARG